MPQTNVIICGIDLFARHVYISNVTSAHFCNQKTSTVVERVRNFPFCSVTSHFFTSSTDTCSCDAISLCSTFSSSVRLPKFRGILQFFLFCVFFETRNICFSTDACTPKLDPRSKSEPCGLWSFLFTVPSNHRPKYWPGVEASSLTLMQKLRFVSYKLMSHCEHLINY